MNYQDINALADMLWQAQVACRGVEPIKDRIEKVAADQSISPLAVAYAVQDELTRRQLKQGARLVGRKIGLTSPVVQQQLGVNEPDFGALFAHMAFGSAEPIAISQWIQPKAEAEIALVLERDLPYSHNTFADLISATAYALPAIEIVDSRIVDWKISLLDTVADNASAAAFVLGSRPVLLKDIDLDRCGMMMTCKGEEVSVGSGAACLGNPLNAAVWLANKLAELETPLRAGDVLLTGALGPIVPVHAGDVLQVEIEGLGSVNTRFVLGKES